MFRYLNFTMFVFSEAKLPNRRKRRGINKNEKISLADGVNLATAKQESAILVTADNDFAGIANVMLV